MGKRKQTKRESFSKRARQELEDHKDDEPAVRMKNLVSQAFHIVQKDRIEDKVDLIIKDAKNNCQGSLTIWGTGLGVEKTIAVVEAIKRNYTREGKRYQQETSIKSDESDQPHLQVILTPVNDSAD